MTPGMAIVLGIIFVAIVLFVIIFGFAKDDLRLKMIFAVVVILYSAALIGIWEKIIKPLYHLLAGGISIG